MTSVLVGHGVAVVLQVGVGGAVVTLVRCGRGAQDSHVDVGMQADRSPAPTHVVNVVINAQASPGGLGGVALVRCGSGGRSPGLLIGGRPPRLLIGDALPVLLIRGGPSGLIIEGRPPGAGIVACGGSPHDPSLFRTPPGQDSGSFGGSNMDSSMVGQNWSHPKMKLVSTIQVLSNI